jgi:hypothetical protein
MEEEMHASAMTARTLPHPPAAPGKPTHPLAGTTAADSGRLSAAHCPAAAVRAQLERVLAHDSFQRAPCLSRVLAYIVDRSLAGEAARLKEYVLGVEALGRGDDFDPRTDTIVRVHCRRLRQKLTDYYRGDGYRDAVVIDIPKGHYGATFQRRPSGIEMLRATLAGAAPAWLRLCSRAVARASRRRLLSFSTAGVLALLALGGWALPGHGESAPTRHLEPAAADTLPDAKIPDQAYLAAETGRP